MIKTRDYFMHQTPRKLAKDLIADIDFTNVKVLYEPFSGENAFYDNFPNGITKHRTEITDGLDFHNFNVEANQIDTIISNPPYQLNGKNAYFSLIMFFFSIDCIQNVYFLSSNTCWNSLTPPRRKVMEDAGIYISKITTCSVKKWRDRYYFIHFSRKKNDIFKYLLEIYDDEKMST